MSPMPDADSGSVSRNRGAAGLPALTRNRIITAATLLTEEHGLEAWTLRQLAAEVKAYPAVIYHHVGDREDVVAAVIDRVLRMVPVPPVELDWRAWFQRLLADLRVVLRQYPGIAHRLCLQGPSEGLAAQAMDRGMQVLRRHGFGQECVLAFNMLLSTGCQFVAMEHDRLASARERLPEAEDATRYRDCPGLAPTGTDAYHALLDPVWAVEHYAKLSDYAIERLLDGLAARLSEQSEHL